MSRLLVELEIDALCWEFLAAHIVNLRRPLIVHEAMPVEDDEAFAQWNAEFRRINSLPDPAGPQPIVALLDRPADEDPDWQELTAIAKEPDGVRTLLETAEHVLGKMGS